MKRDYYEILRLDRNASTEEIKKSFRKIAFECHPDRCPGDQAAEERFKEAQEAYAALSDSESRRRYDLYGFEGLRGQPGFDDFGFSPFEDLFQGIFDDFFGSRRGGGWGKRASRMGKRGDDLGYTFRISFFEAFQGAEKEITFPRDSTCSECRGHGAKPGTEEKTCPKCHGQGEIYLRQGFFTVAQTCRSCRGRGTIRTEFCPVCKGSGRVREEKQLRVKIPPGVDTGVRLRVEGEGEGGVEGGNSGDLFIDIEVESHPLFKREGRDLYLEVPLSFTQAALGTKIEVPVPDGKETVQIKPGVQNGDVLNLKGRGMPSINGYERGNLYLSFIVETPANLNKRQKEILSEFDQIEMEKGSSPRVRSFLEKVKEFFSPVH